MTSYNRLGVAAKHGKFWHSIKKWGDQAIWVKIKKKYYVIYLIKMSFICTQHSRGFNRNCTDYVKYIMKPNKGSCKVGHSDFRRLKIVYRPYKSMLPLDDILVLVEKACIIIKTLF